MPLHQALTRFSDKLRTILPRHEQGGGFAAEGYRPQSPAKSACAWRPAARVRPTLVTGLADAKMDCVPMIAITGQVPRPVIGTDAFQETPIVEVCRGITKHHYLVTGVEDVAADREGGVSTSPRPAGPGRC